MDYLFTVLHSMEFRFAVNILLGIGFLFNSTMLLLLIISRFLSLFVKNPETKIYKFVKWNGKLSHLFIIVIVYINLFFVFIVLTLFTQITGKPVIYLYPQSETSVTIKLEYDGVISYSYPKYQPQIKGWQVTAYPDGTLKNNESDKRYNYLFWDGVSTKAPYDMTKGWVVNKADTEKFFEDKLKYMGLNDKEINEFIVYWVPILNKNNYNLIHFATAEYDNLAKLTVAPKPDTTIRVLMVYKPLVKPIIVEPQLLVPIARVGFTVVEWGGTQYTR